MVLFNVISIYLITIALVTVYWAAYVRTHNGSNFAKTAIALASAMCFYILGYTMELNAMTQRQIVFWNYVEYIGIPFVSALWLTTALFYTGHFRKHRVLLCLAIFVIPIISLVLRFTNDFHHLYFASTGFATELGRLVYVKQTGVWMYVQSVHSMLMILVSMALFIVNSAKSGERQNGKITFTAIASAIAVAGLVLSQVKPFGFIIDYMALCLPATALLMIVAIARFDLLETKSVARSRAFEFSEDAVLLVNRSNCVIDFNASARQFFEYLGKKLSNEPLKTLLEDNPELLKGFQRTEEYVLTLSVGGMTRRYEIRTTNIDNRPVTRGWIKTIRDVTEVYQLNEELRKQAITDELSQLNNRRAFMQLGRDWVSASEQDRTSLFLCMLDIDFFKNVNDQYGHAAGDAVIRELARLLKKHFGQDALVARLGGEEFAVMLSDMSDEAAEHRLYSFLTFLRSHTFRYRSSGIGITISAGFTQKTPGQTLESLMRSADKALYLAKEQGRDRISRV